MGSPQESVGKFRRTIAAAAAVELGVVNSRRKHIYGDAVHPFGMISYRTWVNPKRTTTENQVAGKNHVYQLTIRDQRVSQRDGTIRLVGYGDTDDKLYRIWSFLGTSGMGPGPETQKTIIEPEQLEWAADFVEHPILKLPELVYLGMLADHERAQLIHSDGLQRSNAARLNDRQDRLRLDFGTVSFEEGSQEY